MEGERRRAGDTRVPVLVLVLTDQARPAGGTRAGFARNLSRSGALLQLNQAADVGALVRVTLRLRSQAHLNLTGTVVWVRSTQDYPGYEMGVQFAQELSADLFAKILADFGSDQTDRPPGNG